MRSAPPPRPRFATFPVTLLVAVKLLLCAVVLATAWYGVHRDEFLYFSMGKHLRLFRMDFPPAIAILATLSHALFGSSLAAVRIFPTLEGAALIVLTAMLARELGGGQWAQTIAAFAVLTGPLFLRAGILFQPVVLDQFWWTLALCFLARAARIDDPLAQRTIRRGPAPGAWIGIGIALGLGLLTKFSVFFIATGILGALILTPMRRTLTTRWPWIAAALALAIGSPSIIGQITLGWPVVGQMRDLNAGQLQHVTYASFLSMQLLMLGPVAIVVALVGLIALLVSDRLRAFRVLAWACLLPFAIVMLAHGKGYYAGPIYPTLLAAGAVTIEHAPFASDTWVTHILRWGTVLGIAAYGILLLPISVPILPPAQTAQYAARLGVDAALRTNAGVMDRLPQDYADMLGWENQSRALAAVYRSLTPAEQREAVIGAGNYGEAGAAEFHGPKYGLPGVVSSVGSFWFFGPGTKPGRVLIMIGGNPADIAPMYGSIVEAARVTSPWSVREERDVPIYVARDQKMTLQQVWPRLAGRN